jgi:hypothetical protein
MEIGIVFFERSKTLLVLLNRILEIVAVFPVSVLLVIADLTGSKSNKLACGIP